MIETGILINDHGLAAAAINTLVPEASYSIRGAELIWHDARTCPSAGAIAGAVLDEVHKNLINYAADRRWRVETLGCTWNGWPVSTDRESQSKLIAGFVMLGAGLRTDGQQWKFADGVYRPLSNAQFGAMIAAALAHIQTAFATEAAVLAQINAGTITTTAEIDSFF